MSVGDLALLCVFELGFVVVPGCLVYLALSDGPRTLLRIAVAGVAVGYALEVGFYILSAATGSDPVFWVYPALVGVPALVALGRGRGARLKRGDWSAAAALAGAAVALAAVVVLAINLFDLTPLPGELYGNRYVPDLEFQVAIAGEAKHVWPLDVPALAQEPLRYHYFANLNEAAASKLTGVEQPTVNWRFVPIPLLLVVVGGLIELGLSLSRRAWGGVLCAAMVLFVGRFDPVPLPPGEFFDNLYISDSFLFGLALFLPLLCELIDRIRDEGPEAPAGARAGPWVVVAILLFGCAGGKATILPLVVAGLACALGWALWRHREQVRSVAIALGMSVAAFGISYLALYSSHQKGGSLQAVALAIGKRTEGFASFNSDLPDVSVVRVGAYAVESVAGTIDLLAPLVIGLLAFAVVPRLRSRTESVLIIGMALAGVVLWANLAHPGLSQFFFIWYPFATAGGLAAAGIVAVVEDEAIRRRALVVGIPVAAVLLAIAVVTPRAYEEQNLPKQFADDTRSLTITQGLLKGLEWVRDNTPGDAVIAVNNGYVGPDLARNCGYTAFSERRAMLECEFGFQGGYHYPPAAAVRAGRQQHPFERRFRLNDRIFRRADPEAIRAAHEHYGVDYLVLDRRFSGGPESIQRLDRVAKRVFQALGVIVYSVN